MQPPLYPSRPLGSQPQPYNPSGYPQRTPEWITPQQIKAILSIALYNFLAFAMLFAGICIIPTDFYDVAKYTIIFVGLFSNLLTSIWMIVYAKKFKQYDKELETISVLSIVGIFIPFCSLAAAILFVIKIRKYNTGK